MASNDMFIITYQLTNHKLRILTNAKYDLGKKEEGKQSTCETRKSQMIFFQPCVFLNGAVGAMALWCCLEH